MVGVFLGLAAIVYSSWSVLQNGNALAVAASSITKDQGIASEKLDSATKGLERLELEIKSAGERIGVVAHQVNDQSSEINALASAQRELTQLRAEVDQLREQLTRLQTTQPPSSSPRQP